ncbi:hypothetical protein [Gorillibacterium sp. sgz500922]|uniref:hypothetical protein n=1 Tax=Gorillibacterium sp. sgz500922 TaxID=3446694 RepID=UPI003F6730A6
MTMVNHYNKTNEDREIYCCLRNKVVKADADHLAQYCNGCKMFSAVHPDGGVECVWEDIRTDRSRVVVADPYSEWMENQRRDVTPGLSAELSGPDAALAG